MGKPATLRPLAEMSDDERQCVEDKVLIPDTHVVSVTIGEHHVDLRPLTIKFSKLVKSILDPVSLQVEKMDASQAVFDAMGEIQDAYTKALCVLGQFYKIPLNSEWIEETLDAGEVRKILEQQLELSRSNDHLLLSLRQTLSVVALILDASKTVSPAPSSGTPQLFPPSATPGDAPSPSSSSTTPKGS